MLDSVSSAQTGDQLPLAVEQNREIDAWASSIVAAAMKIVWAMPIGGTTSNDVRRRIARAEALRIGRKQRMRPPVSEQAAPRTVSNTQPL